MEQISKTSLNFQFVKKLDVISTQKKKILKKLSRESVMNWFVKKQVLLERRTKQWQKNIEPYRKLLVLSMLVTGVEGVAYNELGEIELASGEKRKCKVLEIDGSNALVQLFESSTGINLSDGKVRFLGRSMELGVSRRYAWSCI